MNIKDKVTDLIGGTPLLRLGKLAASAGAKGEIVAKVESFNPAGSIKDRVGYRMIQDAVSEGRLKPGGVIIEPTSGNTGVGIAMTAAAEGYRAIMVMPDREKGMQGSVDKAEELAAEIPGSIIAGQFANPSNPQAHYDTTAPEIWADTDGQVDILVATFGTGGTVTGTGRYLREKNPDIKVIAVEPAASPLLSEGKAGPHKIQGIGANFIPEVLDTSVIDEIMTVSDDDALDMMKRLASEEGVLAGVSSGAAVHAALQVAAREENAGKRIIVILPDTGERYLSIF